MSINLLTITTHWIGGGAIFLYAYEININGVVKVNGDQGGTPSGHNGSSLGGGGGGSGGSLKLSACDLVLGSTDAVQAYGGDGGQAFENGEYLWILFSIFLVSFCQSYVTQRISLNEILGYGGGGGGGGIVKVEATSYNADDLPVPSGGAAGEGDSSSSRGGEGGDPGLLQINGVWIVVHLKYLQGLVNEEWGSCNLKQNKQVWLCSIN